MKVFREHLRLSGGKLLVFGYIRANWFERRAIRKLITGGNTRIVEMPRDWPAAKQHRAQFAIGSTKATRARMVAASRGNLSPTIRWLLKPEFNWLDMIGVTVTGAWFLAGFPISATIIGSLLAGASTYLRYRLRALL